MKIIHGSLSALLSDVKEHGKVDGVRVAAVMQSTTESPGLPRYTSWVIVSAHVDWEKWAEWRLVVGRQRGEINGMAARRDALAARGADDRLSHVGPLGRARGCELVRPRYFTGTAIGCPFGAIMTTRLL